MQLNGMDSLKHIPAEMMDQLPSSLSQTSPISHWDFINRWRVDPQANDRSPMVGEINIGTASGSALRSTARRKQQAMFKAWSQARHD